MHFYWKSITWSRNSPTKTSCIKSLRAGCCIWSYFENILLNIIVFDQWPILVNKKYHKPDPPKPPKPNCGAAKAAAMMAKITTNNFMMKFSSYRLNMFKLSSNKLRINHLHALDWAFYSFRSRRCSKNPKIFERNPRIFSCDLGDSFSILIKPNETRF